MRRRLLLVAVLVTFLLLAGVVAWPLLRLPPPRHLFRYGLAPGAKPTGETFTVEGVEFVEIGPGIFRMGSDLHTEGGDFLGRICRPLGLPFGDVPEPSEETPVHWVEFPRGFFIARTEVTNAQYRRYDPEWEPDAGFARNDRPVTGLSYDDAAWYCAWLGGRCDRDIRLPIEAEWECACRGGADTEYCFGDDPERVPEFAVIGAKRPAPVGSRRPNAWGLLDMHGNVEEWCGDRWHDTYEGAPADGSVWEAGGSRYRVIRGGDYGSPAGRCRAASRLRENPATEARYLGFRPAFVLDAGE
jgi:formylglycine-generating enzyme required for sulfatase activity